MAWTDIVAGAMGAAMAAYGAWMHQKNRGSKNKAIVSGLDAQERDRQWLTLLAAKDRHIAELEARLGERTRQFEESIHTAATSIEQLTQCAERLRSAESHIAKLEERVEELGNIVSEMGATLDHYRRRSEPRLTAITEPLQTTPNTPTDDVHVLPPEDDEG